MTSSIAEPQINSQSAPINNKSATTSPSTTPGSEVVETKKIEGQVDKSTAQLLIEIQKSIDALVKETVDGTDQTVKAIGQIKLSGQKWLPMFPTSNLG